MEVNEKTIEECARAYCDAIGVDPDRPLAMGLQEPIRGFQIGFYAHQTVRVAWTCFLREAETMARAMGVTIKQHPDAGPSSWAPWIDENSVIEFRLVGRTIKQNRDEYEASRK